MPRIPRRRRPQVTLFAGMSLAGLFVFSAALELARRDPYETNVRRTLAAGGAFDERTVRAFVRDESRDGRPTLPLLSARAILQWDGEALRSEMALRGREVVPLSGISRATVALGNETGSHAVVTLDRHGFSNPDEVWDLRPIEVAAIGDSFTMGMGVGASESAVARIREKLPATVNLGFAGNSPLCNFATLCEYAAPLRPRVVLWLHYANDLAPFEMERDEVTPLLQSYLEPGFSQHLESSRGEIDAWLRDRTEAEFAQPGPDTVWERFRAARGTRAERVQRVLLLSPIRSLISRALGEREFEWTPHVASYIRLLEHARDRVAAWGGRLVFVYVPDVEEFDQRTSAYLAPVFRSRPELLARVASLGIDQIDLLAAFARLGEPKSLYAWEASGPLGLPHLNASGYAAAAAEILDRLGERLAAPGDVRHDN